MKDVKETFKVMFDIDINLFPENVRKGFQDIEDNHDRAWTLDVYEKNKNNLEKNALFYRGTYITFGEMFEKVEEYANIFSNMNVKEGTEVPMCISNTPEFVISILALNLLGAKINCFGKFDKDYLTEIMNDCNCDFMLATDDLYDYVKESVDNTDNIKKVVLFSLTDSLKDGKDPYIELDKNFYDFENKVPAFKEMDCKVIDKNEFYSYKTDDVKKITEYDIGRINTEFLVTYSSGSTNAHRPKAIVHTNRSLITMGRFQDRDLSDLPPTKDLRGLALIPPHSNTGIITSMSDVLYKACTVCLEPIYQKEFLLRSFAINKPNYASVARNMLVYAAKQLYGNKQYENFKMPYMMLLTSVGEPTSMGEEKFVNKMLRKAKCGVDKLPVPFSPVPISVGGGSCELGGLFFTAYRRYQDLNPKYKLKNKRVALRKYHMVQASVIDENGNHLGPNQIGKLVIKTPTMMKKYKNNKQATEEFYTTDILGRTWADAKVYALIDEYGSVKMLGRIGNELILDDDTRVPMFMIGEEVEKDTKNVLSYEVINVDNTAVIHIEFQPDKVKSKEKILAGIENRINKRFGDLVSGKVTYRVRTFEEGFEGNKSEKRDCIRLANEGITEKCIKPIIEDDNIILVPYDEYINGKQKVLVK